ncbi:MAG: hypothetical protein ACI90V_013954 [Bacillariaceae sp.]|jgi:hypothetical protein
MQSPWLTDERSNNDHNHHRGQQQVPEYDFTAGFERSTSAPPPETSLLFGSSRSSNENVGTGVKVSFLFLSLVDVMGCDVM